MENIVRMTVYMLGGIAFTDIAFNLLNRILHSIDDKTLYFSALREESTFKKGRF